MVFSILPAYLVDVLHLGHARIGFIEGVAVALSFAFKVFAGYLSDVLKNRKPLIMLGALLSAALKPAFALSTGASSMFAVRAFDRMSKGLRSAPTDALIADVSEPSRLGDNFGKRQALYTMGDVLGAVLAMVVMLWSGNNYRLCFYLSVIPAIMAIVVLWLFVNPPEGSHPRAQAKFSGKFIELRDLKKFSSGFWWLMVALFFLMLGRFSETFLALRAKDLGFAVAFLPTIVIFKDVIHALVAWPSGTYADRFSRVQIFGFGLIFMTLAQMVLASASTKTSALIGIGFLGVHLGFTQGLVKALVAQTTPPELRGTAFSLFFLMSAVAIFLGNAVAGSLSQSWGTQATFVGGAIFSVASLVVIYVLFIRKDRRLVTGLVEEI